MRKITETCRGAWASVVFLVGLPFRYVQVALFAKDRAAAHQVMMTHFQRFMSICRAKLVVDGEKPPQGTGCVLCYNEASFMDVAAFGAFMWPHVDRAAAAELYGYFPFGRRALAKCGIDLVPRGNRAGTDKLLNQMVARVKSGERVIWGGEGRITGGDGIGRFKIGASLIAIRAQAPIVPVVFYGGHHIMPFPSVRATPGTVHIRFGTPVPTAGLTEDDARAFTDRLQAIFAGMYEDLREKDAMTTRAASA